MSDQTTPHQPDNGQLGSEIDLQLTKRDAQAYADELGLGDIPVVIMMPDCSCDLGLDDSTDVLKCPKCGKPGVER